VEDPLRPQPEGRCAYLRGLPHPRHDRPRLPGGSILGFAPLLVITPAEGDKVVEIARKAVDQIAGKLMREAA
jgi:hypothetical protein